MPPFILTPYSIDSSIKQMETWNADTTLVRNSQRQPFEEVF